jgi:hypothetical protein
VSFLVGGRWSVVSGQWSVVGGRWSPTIVQRLKALCYTVGLTPTARCCAWNSASRRTLQRAGFLPCG